jgi:two-component SAPR family response regulator
MNIVIIEDEQLSAQSLERLIKKLRPSFKINMVIKSIATAVVYFNENKNTDLIFCDIELTDGPSFNIFSQVEIITPIIFITAFNNYAKEALKTNVIGYLTKPFFEQELETVLQKFETRNIPNIPNISKILRHNCFAKVL